MKTKIITLAILSLVSLTGIFAQDRTTVTATNSEISDNLDLRAVASIFGESNDLADFERRLNNPETQISNLDLNQDNQVDYLRVIETIEGNAHIIVIQSVLGRDTYQDVATVEVQRDNYNRVQVQVVGDEYLYGANYIYEPVYVATPMIYASFWIGNYHPYFSSWRWGYYPTYYYAWSPFPVFRYRSHIGQCINHYYEYNYVNYRRCAVAYNAYRGRRGNGYENRYPNRSFEARNSGYANRYELDKTRNIRTVGDRELVSNSPRNYSYNTNYPRANDNPRNNGLNNSSTRDNSSPRVESPRSTSQYDNTPRSYATNTNDAPRMTMPRENSTTSESSPRGFANPRNDAPRSYTPQNGNYSSYESPRNQAPREVTGQRGNSGYGSIRGNSGGSRRG